MLIKSKCNSIQSVIYRQISSLKVKQEPLPVIKVPKYLETTLAKVQHKEQIKIEKKLKSKQSLDNECNNYSLKLRQRFKENILIISNNNKQLNHYLGQSYKSEDKIPLISKEWMNGRITNGSRMTFHIYDDNPSKLVKESPQEVVTFDSLGLKSSVCDAIQSMSITEPTSIQMAGIPSILDYKNVICSAETGSGKTLTYLAPIIQMIREFKELKGEQMDSKYPKGLVVVPSRELAEQVGRVAHHLAGFCGIGVAVMMGGLPKHLTHTGMDLIISTSGLINPLIKRGVYSLKGLNHLVIDESDTLFDDTFNPEVLDLLSNVLIRDNIGEEVETDESSKGSNPYGVQVVCVSATMPNLNDSLGTVVDIEKFERITSGQLHHIMPHVKQEFYRINRLDRHTKLLELVLKDQRQNKPVMIFSNRNDSSIWIHHYLNDSGVECLRLNKFMSDSERLDQLKKFQTGECNVISCTDLGSRGLDTIRARHVINYDCPHYVSDYIHRSGRTGRLGTTENCLVSTFVSFKPDIYMLQQLELALRLNRPIDSVDANIKQQLSTKMSQKKGKKRKRT